MFVHNLWGFLWVCEPNSGIRAFSYVLGLNWGRPSLRICQFLRLVFIDYEDEFTMVGLECVWWQRQFWELEEEDEGFVFLLQGGGGIRGGQGQMNCWSDCQGIIDQWTCLQSHFSSLVW